MLSWLRSHFPHLFAAEPAPTSRLAERPDFQTEFYYYTLALESLLRSQAIALPARPAQCTIAGCPSLATWTVSGSGEGHLADYCDKHVAIARHRLDQYSLGLRWLALPLTDYYRDYAASKILAFPLSRSSSL
jgi:hypothetical protein